MDYLTSADIWRIALLTLAILLGFNGWWLFLRSVGPAFIDRCADAWRRPLWPVLLGLVPLIIGILAGKTVADAAVRTKLAPLVWFLIIGTLLLLALAGAAGLAALVGRRLASASDAAAPWRSQLRGGLVLSMAFLLPLPGLVPGLPLLLLGGIGAAVLAIFRRKDHPLPQPAPPLPAHPAAAPPLPEAP